MNDIDSQSPFKHIIHNYEATNVQEFPQPNHDKKKEVEEVSKIIHGNRKLTETFLGPSAKVKELKNRLEQA